LACGKICQIRHRFFIPRSAQIMSSKSQFRTQRVSLDSSLCVWPFVRSSSYTSSVALWLIGGHSARQFPSSGPSTRAHLPAAAASKPQRMVAAAHIIALMITASLFFFFLGHTLPRSTGGKTELDPSVFSCRRCCPFEWLGKRVQTVAELCLWRRRAALLAIQHLLPLAANSKQVLRKLTRARQTLCSLRSIRCSLARSLALALGRCQSAALKLPSLFGQAASSSSSVLLSALAPACD